MKKIIVILIVFVTSHLMYAQGVSFEHGTFADALSKAKAENKMIFMDCYTTWCGPCKKMSKEVFPQQEVGDYMNTHFVSIKMDMEKGEGIQLTKMYGVKAFPTLLFMDANGKVMHTKVGGADVAGFIAEAKAANDPTKQFWYIEKQYKDGKRDIATISNYIKALFESFKKDEAKKIGQEFIPSLTQDQYNTEEGFTIVAYTGVDFKSEPYNYILNNRAIFEANEKIGQQSVDYVLSNAISSYINGIASTGTLEELKSAIEETKKDFINPQQEMIETNYYNTYYLANKQFDTWFEANKMQADEATEKNMRLSMYINTAYNIAVNPDFSQAGLYERAIKLTERIPSEDPEFLAAYYCLAELYKKVGNKSKALENINIFIKKNTEKGGVEDKRVTDLKLAIGQMQ
ncbi:DUF255 domain-containing protein [Flavivirga spongiicola]|uniref:DUF255 domain-containing protein n=1 Tax=Flavivirga spongiicola TaxID=421621 RepID=A0ABU7XVZ6_9FLAO|nr:DUF255 domain-containing protein [Flavivirga sp. MEBiC05379]MDO5979683.1 DUF255 domain-containing protein [Flavivirga sp. MEBiC05379]